MFFDQLLATFIRPCARVCAFYFLIQVQRMTGSPILCFDQASYVFGLYLLGLSLGMFKGQLLQSPAAS
jgi:hypothetical protein